MRVIDLDRENIYLTFFTYDAQDAGTNLITKTKTKTQ